MLPAISQVCTLNSSFEQDLEDYAAGACHAIEIWLGKLDAYLERHALHDAQHLLAEHQMQAPVASFQGGLLTSQGEARREHWHLFARRLAICQQLQIGTLVVAGDLLGPLTQQDLDRAIVSLKQAAEQAGSHGVRLAFEFQSQATFANNLQTAAALIAQVGSPHLGLCFDVFHYYRGPSKLEDLGYLSAENLFHVQLSDLSGQARELAADADRIVPGDGDFQLQPMLEHFRHIGYRGHVSLELMNPQVWQNPTRQVAEIGMTALRKLLGQASME